MDLPFGLGKEKIEVVKDILDYARKSGRGENCAGDDNLLLQRACLHMLESLSKDDLIVYPCRQEVWESFNKSSIRISSVSLSTLFTEDQLSNIDYISGYTEPFNQVKMLSTKYNVTMGTLITNALLDYCYTSNPDNRFNWTRTTDEAQVFDKAAPYTIPCQGKSVVKDTLMPLSQDLQTTSGSLHRTICLKNTHGKKFPAGAHRLGKCVRTLHR